MFLKLIVILSTLSLNACQSPFTVKKENLYKQIGGMDTIKLLATTIINKSKKDVEIGFLFAEINQQDFQQLLVAQICNETGGQCSYQGLNMREAHSGMNINSREFDVFVSLLIESMEDLEISYQNQNKLLKIFAPMRKNIMYK